MNGFLALILLFLLRKFPFVMIQEPQLLELHVINPKVSFPDPWPIHPSTAFLFVWSETTFSKLKIYIASIRHAFALRGTFSKKEPVGILSKVASGPLYRLLPVIRNRGLFTR